MISLTKPCSGSKIILWNSWIYCKNPAQDASFQAKQNSIRTHGNFDEKPEKGEKSERNRENRREKGEKNRLLSVPVFTKKQYLHEGEHTSLLLTQNSRQEMYEHDKRRNQKTAEAVSHIYHKRADVPYLPYQQTDLPLSFGERACSMSGQSQENTAF